MNILIQNINSRQHLAEFVKNLAKEASGFDLDWENDSLDSYLYAMSRWIEDMEGFFKNRGEVMPEDIPWKIFAYIIKAATIYE